MITITKTKLLIILKSSLYVLIKFIKKVVIIMYHILFLLLK
nr:hypothetical protein (GP22 region) - fluke (Schistosoma mansoni) [Schistosoma mansoni]